MFKVRQTDVKSDLRQYIDTPALEKVTTHLIELGCRANKMTGNTVVPQENNVGDTSYSNHQDGRALVSVVQNIEKTSQNLTRLASTIMNPSATAATVLPPPQAMTSMPEMSAAPKIPPRTEITEYNLKDGAKVTGIIENTDPKGGFIIEAKNSKGQLRSIQVHANGDIKNYRGGDKIDSAIDSQMKAEIANIFQHFGKTLPTPPSGATLSAPPIAAAHLNISQQMKDQVQQMRGNQTDSPKNIAVVPIEPSGKTRGQLIDSYHKFAEEKGFPAQAFHSVEQFQESKEYKHLPNEKKEELQQLKGKNVIILTFDSVEHAKEYIKQAKKEGVLSDKQAQKVLSQIDADYPRPSSSPAPK
jgi:hypothetical protein